MLVLPDRRAPKGKLFLPLRRRDWMREGQLWRVTGRLDDGHVVWRGWFADREDWDAFVWAQVSGSLPFERELWELPSPAWHPDFGLDLWYAADTVDAKTTPTGSLETWTCPADWDNAANHVETIGGGGSGGIGVGDTSTGRTGTGGGGGAYNRKNNISFASPGTSTANWQLATGGAAKVGTATGNGNDGNDTWFNGSSRTVCSVGSQGGLHGLGANTTGTTAGGTAGLAANGTGTDDTANGGAGGQGTQQSGNPGRAATGGGGAGGPNGAGATAEAINTQTKNRGNGGAGDAGSGGSAGSGTGSPSYNGGDGAEWGAGIGSGGGGAGGAGLGGNYGAGGGGQTSTSGSTTSGKGASGLIVITYTPKLYVPAKMHQYRLRRV